MQLNELTLIELIEGIRDGRFLSEEVVTDCLTQISQTEADVLAWEWLNPDAVQKAKAADRFLKTALEPLPLHGIPIGVKDIIATQGIPTTMGSPIYTGHIPDRSATVVRQIEAAGGFCFGKTVTTEFAWRNPGKTRNPWNPEHTPGGSSSGSAAAVAAKFVPAALGTQTLGSIVRPAAYCGVVGYKPSYGLISRDGVHPLSPTLDHVGVLTRSVADARLLSHLLVDPSNANSGDRLFVRPQAEVTPRFAAVKSPVWHLAAEHQKQHFAKDLRHLEKSGAVIYEVELPPLFETAHAVAATILKAEASQFYQPIRAQHPGMTSPALDILIEEGLEVKAVQYLDALSVCQELKKQLNELMLNYDAILTPPAPGEAPKTLTHTGDPAFCTIWTLCGVPAVTIPTGWGPSGLPLGLQIVGFDLDDGKTLQLAEWCELQFGTVI